MKHLFFNFPLTRSAMLQYSLGWWLKAHILLVTPHIAVCILFRTRDDGYTKRYTGGPPEGWEPCECARDRE